MSRAQRILLTTLIVSASLPAAEIAADEQSAEQTELDQRVEEFLEEHRDQWRDMNVPETDGQLLFELIVENEYTKALDIGTSTGHSAIWMAWALSKTGGRLITIEINEGRHKQALKNFEEAGLSDYIDARLADAHELVPELEGPFDFVFVDADKDWYSKYFEAVLPKLEEGGCYTAHNVSNMRLQGINEFLKTLENTLDLETEIVEVSRSGVSVSYWKAGKEKSPEKKTSE
jgi:predicted O-methyltransferase YrrM